MTYRAHIGDLHSPSIGQCHAGLSPAPKTLPAGQYVTAMPWHQCEKTEAQCPGWGHILILLFLGTGEPGYLFDLFEAVSWI